MRKFQLFKNYLVIRFQIIPLLILLFSDILVIKRITNDMVIHQWKLYLCFIFTLFYLFHNRVADDKRDFDFDMEFYPDRDLQAGYININILNNVSYLMIALMVISSIIMGMLSFLAFIPLVFYTLLAKKDFFLSDVFKSKRLFTYNFINMIQLLLLQIFIYISILNSFMLSNIVLIHILFVFILSIQVEITRKIKPEKSPGNELYSDRLGMKNSIMLWGFFGILSTLTCIWLASTIDINMNKVIHLELFILFSLIISGYLFLRQKSTKYENIFWFGLFLSYVGQNMILIYA